MSTFTVAHHPMMIGGPRDGDHIHWKQFLPVQQVHEKATLDMQALSTFDPSVEKMATVRIHKYVMSSFWLSPPSGAPDSKYTFYRTEAWSEKLATRVLLLRIGILDLYGAVRFE